MLSIFDSNPRSNAFSCVEDEFNKVFDRFFTSNTLSSIKSKMKSDYPKLDVLETETQYIIEAAVPGVKTDDRKIEVVPFDSLRSSLRITGKLDDRYQHGDSASYYYKELRRRAFEREVILKEGLIGDPVAEHEDGILRLSWKKEVKATLPETKLIAITKK